MNITLKWKQLAVTNTQSYGVALLIATVKCFVARNLNLWQGPALSFYSCSITISLSMSEHSKAEMSANNTFTN
jgi:hypothetical protein